MFFFFLFWLTHFSFGSHSLSIFLTACLSYLPPFFPSFPILFYCFFLKFASFSVYSLLISLFIYSCIHIENIIHLIISLFYICTLYKKHAQGTSPLIRYKKFSNHKINQNTDWTLLPSMLFTRYCSPALMILINERFLLKQFKLGNTYSQTIQCNNKLPFILWPQSFYIISFPRVDLIRV